MNELDETWNPAVSMPGPPPIGPGRLKTATIEVGELRTGSATGNPSFGSQRVAFAGLFLFTLLLYLRPNELFPEVFGTFPLARIVAIVAVVAYLAGRLGHGERLTIVPLELKMLGVITLLGLLFAPVAAAPQDTIDVMLDMFLKVSIIFVLMINLIDTPKRLRAMFSLVVVCGTFFAALAVKSYLIGDFVVIEKKDIGVVGLRIIGAVGGFIGNPNDLATTLNMLLPFAVALSLLSGGLKRLFYAACAVILVAGIVVSFSRGGFLGLIAMGAVLLWKVGSQSRGMTALAFAVIFGVFVVAMPGGYGGRVLSIFNLAEDRSGTSEQRRDLLERAASIAFHHPIVGVGMGNFHIYSIHELVAHNSYLEIAAELGLVGLLAYLVLIFAPLRSLRRIERANGPPTTRNAARVRGPDPKREVRYLCIALQATLVAYIVCSFFGSIQYQWYLYYPVAYAIALRRISGAESASTVTAHGVLFTKPESPRDQLSASKRDERSNAGVLFYQSD